MQIQPKFNVSAWTRVGICRTPASSYALRGWSRAGGAAQFVQCQLLRAVSDFSGRVALVAAGESIPAQDKLIVLAQVLKVEPEVLRWRHGAQVGAEHHQRWQEGVGYLERETFDAFCSCPPAAQADP